jgi:cell division protein FtsQ
MQGRRRRALLVLARVGIVLLLALLACQGVRLALGFVPLRVQRLEVTGIRHLDRGTVLALADVPSGARIFQVPLNKVAARLAAHPAVQQVRVSRHLPSTIRIAIKERPLAFLVRCGERDRFLDRGGGILATDGCITAGVPRLFGVGCAGSSRRRAQAALACLEALEQHGLEARQISIAPSGSISARLTSGILLKMGLPEDLPEKALRARFSLAGLPPGSVEYLDMSALSAVVWKPLPEGTQARR